MIKRLSTIMLFPLAIWQLIITYIPGIIGFKLRHNFWKKRLRILGRNAKIDIGVHFQNPQFISIDSHAWIDRNVIVLAGPPGPKRITYIKSNTEFTLKIGEIFIGENTHIAPNCVLSGIGGIYIGKNCGVASNSAIYSFSHHYKNLNDKKDSCQYSFSPLCRIDQQSMVLGPIVIEDYCAIGLNSTVLPGSLIKKGTWVSCGSVLSGEYQEQTLVFTKQLVTKKSLEHLKIKE